MRFRIGGVFAKCSACNADDFYPAHPIAKGRRDIFVCAACGHETLHAELVRTEPGGAPCNEKNGARP